WRRGFAFMSNTATVTVDSSSGRTVGTNPNFVPSGNSTVTGLPSCPVASASWPFGMFGIVIAILMIRLFSADTAIAARATTIVTSPHIREDFMGTLLLSGPNYTGTFPQKRHEKDTSREREFVACS